MKNNQLIGYASKVVLVSGAMLFSFSCLNAWTISILDAASTSTGNGVISRGTFSTFRNYMTDAGATLTTGTLGNYVINDSDAVIVNLHNSGTGYTAGELTVLSNLLNSNTRVLVFGELSSSWDVSNKDLANVVGGVYNYSGQNAQTVNPSLYPLITDGVNNINFAAVGKISPNGGNGLSLSSGDGMTLWGANENFLLFMDVDLMSGHVGDNDNNRLTQNIANWLSGADLAPIPEPSAYAAILGLGAIATLSLRRRRSHQ